MELSRTSQGRELVEDLDHVGGLIMAALIMALEKRRWLVLLVLKSDRGSQYKMTAGWC
ncbi:hypothetical protein [Cupriavidus oxalaticus]|jgi:hypothetical protein|uniref:Uncharacterized protein n=1 Tax=Cupriavidus oxalaticus TaxID=96344 RepID=A0A375GF89_9BURK|nr:hypothetical protein [Cupriavidus oxalaticus]QRQ84636.1 hypothetical protein JTE91_00580 [Cupriavidus oxalaticus]QRQ91275.1 hypothetical protein JTE92_11765 [Cupriavidus oxalaticus]WQD85833.1 hypothetical protein U0036_29920 [Cupriavidus oxalaticus]SPC20641.1 hypothetical protein CO2235_MP30016 [Cupriavidus oxalaticus]